MDAAAGYTAPDSMGQIIRNLLMSVIANPVEALSNANYIGILFWAVILGLALKRAGDTTKKTMEDLADAVSEVVRWVISCAPFDILGLVFEAVSTSGLEIFTTYGELVLILVGSMLIVALVVNPLIVGVGFIISVIQDSLETALNSSGDVIFTATAEFLEWKKEGKELPL